MEMTEAKAMTKRCPFAAMKAADGRGSIAADRCVGDDCMAWQFTGYKPVAGGTNDEAHGRCGMVQSIKEMS